MKRKCRGCEEFRRSLNWVGFLFVLVMLHILGISDWKDTIGVLIRALITYGWSGVYP